MAPRPSNSQRPRSSVSYRGGAEKTLSRMVSGWLQGAWLSMVTSPYSMSGSDIFTVARISMRRGLPTMAAWYSALVWIMPLSSSPVSESDTP